MHDYESTTILSKRFQIFTFDTKKFFAKSFVNLTRQSFANSFVIAIFVERKFVVVISQKFFDISSSFVTSFQNFLTNDFISIISALISTRCFFDLSFRRFFFNASFNDFITSIIKVLCYEFANIQTLEVVSFFFEMLSHLYLTFTIF